MNKGVNLGTSVLEEGEVVEFAFQQLAKGPETRAVFAEGQIGEAKFVAGVTVFSEVRADRPRRSRIRGVGERVDRRTQGQPARRRSEPWETGRRDLISRVRSVCVAAVELHRRLVKGLARDENPLGNGRHVVAVGLLREQGKAVLVATGALVLRHRQ